MIKKLPGLEQARQFQLASKGLPGFVDAIA
ncbi:hypothetical protein X474_02945 [Dethiosulfatarculus sandiegensis]|uniref:Uncharacterized protein n=1 Tax=Dethiosulfatarculus sandiegensis TaxID=1429043 RepID=A0A0D2JJ90_9BACT|nr:hypothetical protein X474_02945 [Dethiosulfatarculus sandiegensis]